MRILHISPHLGGGVGKAHSALCALDGPDIERHFLLLEKPRDPRYADAIRASGAAITISDDPATIRRLADDADIVQIEWWNHPRLYECLCRCDLPPGRTILWAHISGLFAPLIPPGLLSAPHRFLFSSACSLEAPGVQSLSPDTRARLGVVNSGFGFDAAPSPTRRGDAIAYLGTVDFSKLSPALFDIIDRAAPERPVDIWGQVDPAGEVMARAQAMADPRRVRFRGHADDPEAALRGAGIFLYPLQPRHFGTAENALVEAMSLGCVPLVLDNPAERTIVEHGRTGFVEPDAASAADRLDWMLRHPEALIEMGARAAESMAATRSAAQASADFAAIYRAVLPMDKRSIDYAGILGSTPADWFLSTQDHNGGGRSAEGAAHKGTLAHFLQCFPGDASLRALATETEGLQTSTVRVSSSSWKMKLRS